MTTKDEFQVDVQIMQKESQEVTKNLNELSQTAQKVRDLFDGKTADSYFSITREKVDVPTRNIAGHLMGNHSKKKDVEVKIFDEDRLNQDFATTRGIIKDLVENVKNLESQNSELNSLYENKEEILDKLQEIRKGNAFVKKICDVTTRNYLDETDQKIKYIESLIQDQEAITETSSIQDDYDQVMVMPVGKDGDFFPKEVS